MDAKECVQAADSFIKAHQSNQSDLIEELDDDITQKAAKILLNTKLAKHAHARKKISKQSLESFHKTLHIAVRVIQLIPDSQEIFKDIVKQATQNWEEKQKKRLRNRLQSLIIGWSQNLEIKSLNESQKLNHVKNDLEAIIKKAQENNQLQSENLDTLKSLKSESQNIRQDLEAILKRAVNALVEERISQDSFQSFRVVWQIAVGEVTK